MSIASALALGAVLLGLARAGLRRTALGTGMLVLLFAGLLPAGQLLLLPAVALSVLFLWLLVLLAAYLFVMAGRALALLLPALLGAAGIALVTWQARSSGLLVPELLVRWAAGGAILSCTLLAGGALWLAAWLVAVRREEHRDVTRERRAHQPGRVHWDVEHLDRVQEREDTGLQNHLITVSRLKPGGLRLRTLRRVLRGVQLVAKIYANRGDLGGIRTIHFARFIILPDQKRLLFLANYDGGFASYLHEFNAVSGVTAVWSNCVGFPRSYFLVGDGASDEQRFKAFGRRDQLETLGWYSAYPELSIRDIEFATQTREDLQRPLDDPASWLGRLRARFGLPLSEADCDLALRRL